MPFAQLSCPDPFTRPPLPSWLLRCEEQGRSRVSTAHWRKMYWSTPPWLDEVQRAQIRRIYESATSAEHVDHIVPLKSPIVCGLHVPWNLQVIGAGPNLHKSNHTWPGHPNETRDMFPEFTPQQLSLF